MSAEKYLPPRSSTGFGGYLPEKSTLRFGYWVLQTACSVSARPERTSLRPMGALALEFLPAMTDLRISASITSTVLPSSARLLPR